MSSGPLHPEPPSPLQTDNLDFRLQTWWKINSLPFKEVGMMSEDTNNFLIAFGIVFVLYLLIWFFFQRKAASDSPAVSSSFPADPKEEQKKVVFGKEFKFAMYDEESEANENEWFRLERWKSPHFVKMKTSWDEDKWAAFPPEVTAMGINKDPQRGIAFLNMSDRSDFRIFLMREPTNPVDPNAIKVMASATVDGEQRIRQLGYIPKDLAEMMKDERELDARPHCAYLPYQGRELDLKIRVLSGR